MTGPCWSESLLTVSRYSATVSHSTKLRYELTDWLEHVINREYELAKEALRRGDKRRARLALQQRAYQHGLITKTDTQLATLQELVRCC